MECEKRGIDVSSIFVEKARSILLLPDHRLSHESFRKMVFMVGYERYVELEELRTERISPHVSRTIKLRLSSEKDQSDKEIPSFVERHKYFQHSSLWFDVVEGTELINVTDSGFAQYIAFCPSLSQSLSPSSSSSSLVSSLTPDAQFVDLNCSNSLISILPSEERQRLCPEGVMFADVLYGPTSQGKVYIQFYIRLSQLRENLSLSEGVLEIRRRYIDFTTNRVISHLRKLDSEKRREGTEPLFIRILMDPNGEGVRDTLTEQRDASFLESIQDWGEFLVQKKERGGERGERGEGRGERRERKRERRRERRREMEGFCF